MAGNDGLQALKQALHRKDPARLYVFYGEEAYLLRYYVDQLRKKLIDELTESFNYHHFNSENFSPEGFGEAVENLPMMAERTMIHAEDIDLFGRGALSEDAKGYLAGVLADIPDYCTVVFTYETVAWKPLKEHKALYQAVTKNAAVVEFAKQSQRDLIPWVARRFAALNKHITPELCGYLIELTGGGMTQLQGEISKIAAFSGADEIKRYDIDAVTEPVLDAVVFQMTDRMAQGDYDGALRKLQQLLKMQQEPIPILGAIGAHFRRLSAARTLIDSGKGADTLMELCGMRDFAARKTMAAAKRFSADFCRRAAQLVVETDHAMKTSFDEPERLLELLIVHLAQEEHP